MLPTPAACDRNYNPQMPPQHFRSLSANQRFRRPGLTGNVHLTMDSELSPSLIGSYLNPPERMYPPSFIKNETSQIGHPVNSEVTPPKMINSPNNQALVSALKTLQEKIHRIELERTQAEDNLNSLSREAAQYKKALENETNERNLAHQELIKQKKDISIQLSSARSRCILLEKQLEYTKRMVLNVEREKAIILEQQLQTGLEISRLLMSTVSQSQPCKGKKKPPKKTKSLKREPPQQMDPKCRARSLEREKTISAYGLRSFQRPAPVAEPQCRYQPLRTASWGKAVPPDSGEPVPVCDSLSDLLMAMQEELDQMAAEHRELLRHTGSHSVSDDMERQLEQLVKKMESKEGQISKLKRHQDSVRKLQQKVQNSRINESSGIRREDGNPKGPKNVKNSPRKCWDEANPFQKHSTCHPAQVHNLQVKLRKDDIKWEQ
ncbi:centrosomal protein CEP57L1 isoform X4 [Arvicola amphibius]|uniref:centrosomal protein CEP57L1 isoform X4 n=1 Tax=Arvicola amphibius TaxID=1047088 RepID=UPI0018E331B9|nr:centrosomal protein CEP57L1 isoform X4 [Arvicola amphibius]